MLYFKKVTFTQSRNCFWTWLLICLNLYPEKRIKNDLHLISIIIFDTWTQYCLQYRTELSNTCKWMKRYQQVTSYSVIYDLTNLIGIPNVYLFINLFSKTFKTFFSFLFLRKNSRANWQDLLFLKPSTVIRTIGFRFKCNIDYVVNPLLPNRMPTRLSISL